MGNNSEHKTMLNWSTVGLLSTLAFSPSLQAQHCEDVAALLPSASWSSQHIKTNSGYISVALVADHKYGVASVDFYLDGKLHSKVVQQTYNNETGEYEFVLSFLAKTAVSKYKINAVINPFGVGHSSQISELTIRV